MTVSSVAAAARQHARFSVVPRRAGLVTVESCPSPSAAALTREGVATTARRKKMEHEHTDEVQVPENDPVLKAVPCMHLSDCFRLSVLFVFVL